MSGASDQKIMIFFRLDDEKISKNELYDGVSAIAENGQVERLDHAGEVGHCERLFWVYE